MLLTGQRWQGDACHEVIKRNYQNIDPLGIDVYVESTFVGPENHDILPLQPPHRCFSICYKNLKTLQGGSENNLQQHLSKVGYTDTGDLA